jgi:hypothetical protein
MFYCKNWIRVPKRKSKDDEHFFSGGNVVDNQEEYLAHLKLRRADDWQLWQERMLCFRNSWRNGEKVTVALG